MAPVVPARERLTVSPRLTTIPPATCFPPQSIQPTANLDRTDDLVYLNVMELVRAVLDLKNELCQLPPEGYVVVVKVRAADRVSGGCSPWPWVEGDGPELPCPPSSCLSQKDSLSCKVSAGF